VPQISRLPETYQEWRKKKKLRGDKLKELF
jgi:hypothetical protein